MLSWEKNDFSDTVEIRWMSKTSILTSKFDILRLNGFHDVYVFFLIIKWSSDKVEVTVNKFGVHSRHVIICFLLYYAMFCLA